MEQAADSINAQQLKFALARGREQGWQPHASDFRSGGDPGTPNDRFTLRVLYCGEGLSWDVCFNAATPAAPPDLIVRDMVVDGVRVMDLTGSTARGASGGGRGRFGWRFSNGDAR